MCPALPRGSCRDRDVILLRDRSESFHRNRDNKTDTAFDTGVASFSFVFAGRGGGVGGKVLIKTEHLHSMGREEIISSLRRLMARGVMEGGFSFFFLCGIITTATTAGIMMDGWNKV